MTDTVYNGLESFILDRFNRGLNFIIVSVPGAGIGHELNKLCKKHNFNYIITEQDAFGDINIVDIDFHNKTASVASTLLMFNRNKRTDPKNYFGIVVDAPYIIESTDFKKSDLPAHIWDYYYFKARTLEETDYLLKNWGFDYDKDKTQKIFELSNGLTRVIKYFANFPESMDKSTDELFNDETFIRVYTPSIQVIAKLDEKTKLKMGLDPKNTLAEAALRAEVFIEPKDINIEINEDLTFSENNKLSSAVLSTFEAMLIKALMDQGVVTRDHIAEIKWGENYSEKFSDQAINQAVARLNDKLESHIIKAVSKLGYKLSTK